MLGCPNFLERCFGLLDFTMELSSSPGSARRDLEKIAIRSKELTSLKEVISLGGDALKDFEAIYE